MRANLICQCFACLTFPQSGIIANHGCACMAEEANMVQYSNLEKLPRPRVIYETDFTGEFHYSVPHRHDTSRQAAEVREGMLIVTVKPGMHGASSDAPNNERAEYSHSAPLNALVRQSFRIRVDPDFTAPKRTLGAQIKPDPISPRSPPVALYLSEGGALKWVEYPRTGNGQEQHHVKLKDFEIDLLDGRWHSVSMEYLRSSQDGFCRVTVDQKVVIDQHGYCSNPGGEKLNARIGIYRDALPIEQRVYFADWRIDVLAE